MSKTTLHMKIDASLKDQLRKAAESQNRNLSNLIETLLKQALQSGK